MKLDINKDIGMQLPAPNDNTKCLITVFSVFLMLGLIGFGLYQKNYWKFTSELQSQAMDKKREAAINTKIETDIVNADFQHLQHQFNELKKELIALSRESSIQQATNKELNRKLLRTEDELTATKNKQLLYKDILAADDLNKGLHIRHFGMRKMEGNGDEHRYHYTLVLSQTKTGRKIVKGQYIIRIQGVEKGKTKNYNHRELAADGIEAERLFSLKYYQSLEGDIVLPKGYKPNKATVWVIPKNKKFKTQRKSYQWKPLTDKHLSGL